MDGERAVNIIKQPQIQQRRDKRSLFSIPVSSQFNSLGIKPCQHAARTVPRCPGPQLKKRHDSLKAQPFLELFALGMIEEIQRQSNIYVHRLTPLAFSN